MKLPDGSLEECPIGKRIVAPVVHALAGAFLDESRTCIDTLRAYG